MTIAMDFAEFIEPNWNGFDGIHLMDWNGERVLVMDVPGCTNLNASIDCVQSLLAKNGIYDPSRSDIVDAILACRC